MSKNKAEDKKEYFSDALDKGQIFSRKYKHIPIWLGWIVFTLYLTGILVVEITLIKRHSFSVFNWIWRLIYITGMYQLGILFKRTYTEQRPMAKGYMVVLIPAYNEQEELLYKAIDSLLGQTRVPDEIHVIDDGSKIEIKPYIHEKVFWHRQENKGKRHAQAYALSFLDVEKVDFILTVDSDSLINKYACENLLRALSDPTVEAVTGLTYTMNYAKNLITRIVDINLGVGCVTYRSAYNSVGALATTSGPLTMYRARVLFDNVEDYLTSGTFGDDRRLNMYALLYGKTISIPEAFCYTDGPDNMKQLYKQRLRWAISPWKQLPFSIVNLSLKQNIFIIFNVASWLVALFFYIYIAFTICLTRSVTPLIVLIGINIYYSILMTTQYLYGRLEMDLKEKLYTLFVIVPVEVIFKLFFLTHIKTIALFHLKNKSWGTRVSK